MGRVKIKFKILRKGVKLPSFQYEDDAGFDLRANLDEEAIKKLNPHFNFWEYQFEANKMLYLNPTERLIIPTGLKVELPNSPNKKYVMKIYPRSGLSLKLGLTLINSVGIIDQNYRGEIGILTINLSGGAILINEGMRIAQAIVEEIPYIDIIESKELTKTQRGEGGFGSTGI